MAEIQGGFLRKWLRMMPGAVYRSDQLTPFINNHGGYLARYFGLVFWANKFLGRLERCKCGAEIEMIAARWTNHGEGKEFVKFRPLCKGCLKKSRLYPLAPEEQYPILPG